MEYIINTDSVGSGDYTFTQGMGLEALKVILLKDKAFRKEYYKPDDVGFELGIIRKIKGITQEELAKKVGTKQPSISRMEEWGSWGSLKFLHKIAKALGCYIEIEIKETN